MHRRAVLKLLGLTPFLAHGYAFAQAAAPPARSFVLIELQGGNDGLNTVIPYADPVYRRSRPTIAQRRDQVIPLNESLGLHPSLEGLLPAWKDRELALILGVGYPRPNRSHFRSIEIWESASDREVLVDDGWVARTLRIGTEARGAIPDAVVLDPGDLGPLRGAGLRTLVMDAPASFARSAAQIRSTPQYDAHGALGHILKVEEGLRQTGELLWRRLQGSPEIPVVFPRGAFGQQCRRVTKLLASGFDVPVFKLSLSGFDTHAQQRARQDRLLKELADGLAALRAALQEAGLWDRVLVMTYSEFGRRVAENANRGTDHGTAAPHLVLGGQVNGGLYGQQPSLTDLQQGDLLHTVDFRSLYATVVRRWWRGGRDIFGPRIPTLDFL